ncbi:MAG TPA: ATP-binding protein [Steroidobacteraceae bacterium]|jgi:signal transduction histidine kinase/integral membrane sensor domain MASE1|nr:ATP-binding protein [Steroidobacteraceae bacterium]
MAIDLPFPSEQPGGLAVRHLVRFARRAAPPIATALAYVLAAKVGAWLAFPSAPVSALWAPNAILLAALVLTRQERWWLYLLTVLPFHFAVQLPDATIARVAIQFGANAAEAVLGAWALVLLSPHPRRFDRLRTVLVLILFAGVIAPLATSFLMVLAFSLADIEADFWLTVVVRTITNTFAIVALVPLIVHAVTDLRSGRRQVPLWNIVEAAALAIALAAVCALVFAIPAGERQPSVAWLFAPLPILAWATIRFRVVGACSAALVVGAISTWGVLNGHGPFDVANPIENALSLVSFHVVICVTFVLCAALLEEWRHATRALASSEARFRNIFEHNIIPTAIWHGGLKITDANDAFLKLTGYGREEIAGGAVAIDQLAAGFSAGGGDTGVAEAELRLPGGQLVPVVLGQARFDEGDGGVLYAFDLSPFRSAEAGRVRAEGLHAAVLGSVHDQIAVLDGNGTLIEINESWLRAVQLSHPARFDRVLAGDSYLGAAARAAESGDRAAGEHLNALQSVLEGRETRCQFEYTEPAGMEQAWIEVSIEKLRRPEGGAVVTRADISARKRAEHEARVQQQQLTHLGRAAVLGQLSGAFAHELNQPLTSILGNAEAALRLIDNGEADFAELREILRDIVHDDLRAAQVIDRLRALLEKGEMLRRPVDLGATVREVLEIAKSELITRHVRVTVDLDPNLPVVMADRVQMQQILLNLLMNACEAMGGLPVAERKVRLATRYSPAESCVQVTVEDGGCGIPAGDLERIFQPFVTSKSSGMGMGLAICRSVAESHRGRLWAESEGCGATFYLQVPMGGSLA